MEFKINSSDLLKALSHIHGIVEVRHTLPILSNIILKAKDDVFEGKDFIKSLQQESIFPDIFTQLISSGYKSGNLAGMFNKVSQFMKAEIETKRSVFLSLLEPIVIILMGGFIMLIVLAILIPIMQMNTLAI